MPVTINGDGTITGLSVGGLPDGIVDTDVLANNAVTSAKTTVAGITMAEQWRMNSDSTAGAETVLQGWSKVTTANHQGGTIGNNMSVSSGVFTFPSTGIYYITGTFVFYVGTSNDAQARVFLKVSYDGSNYNTVARFVHGEFGDGVYGSASQHYLVDVDNTSNVKVYFQTESFSSDSKIMADSTVGETNVSFIRLGDT